MSSGIRPFAVNLKQIRKVIGSKSKSLFRELREEFEDELEEDREAVEEANLDDDFDPELPIEDALRHLIMDEERWDYEGSKYARAVEMLCTFYGEILPNDHWTAASWDWIESVSDAILESGVSTEKFSLAGHLLERGSPIDLPEIDDFPWVGYLKNAEIPAVLEALTEERIARLKLRDAARLKVSLLQLREWLETCVRDKSDLICFYD